MYKTLKEVLRIAEIKHMTLCHCHNVAHVITNTESDRRENDGNVPKMKSMIFLKSIFYHFV